jgi:hypothetical protein
MAMAPTSRAARQGHPRHRRVGNHAADGAGGEEADVNADEAGNGNSSGATTMQSKPWPKLPRGVPACVAAMDVAQCSSV